MCSTARWRWVAGMLCAPLLYRDFGGLLVVVGIALFAWVVAHEAARDQRDVQALRSERGR